MDYVRGYYKVGTRDATPVFNFGLALAIARRRAKTEGPIHILSTCCVVDSDGKTLHFKND